MNRTAQVWLIVTAGARSTTVELRKKKPVPSSLNTNQVVVALHLNIPEEVFTKPEFNAAVVVDPDQVIKPEAEVEVTQKPIRIKRLRDLDDDDDQDDDDDEQ